MKREEVKTIGYYNTQRINSFNEDVETVEKAPYQWDVEDAVPYRWLFYV